MAVKVLILEDNPVARSFLCRVVRESFSDTIVITEAGDLESARRQILLTGGSQGLHGVDPFKLILVDLELPDGNGMELLAELAAYPATKIVTTLYSDDDHLFPALQRGADGYLLKEDRFEVLVENGVADMKPDSGAWLSLAAPGRKCVSRRLAMAGESGGWPRTIFCSSSTSTSKRSSFSR